MQSQWLKIIAQGGNLRGVAIQATTLVQQLADLHGLTGPSAQALGEVAIAALLNASNCKNGERININIRSSGTVKQALVDAHPDGSVRGYVIENPTSVNAGSRLQALHESFFWGVGTLSVLKTAFEEGKQPYIGTVPLVTGSLAKDMTFYYHQSEQIPSAVGIAVNVDSETGRITSAGGFLVQVLPGATPEEIDAVAKHIDEIQSLSKQVAQNGDPLALLSEIFQSTTFILLETKPIRFECNCSVERVERALALVGKEELEFILKEGKGASVRCEFCAKDYQVDSPRIQELIAGV